MAPPPAQLLSGLRIGVGVGAWLAPNLAGKAFGLDPAGNPQSAYMGRLFGVRDAALAIGTTATPPASRQVWWQIGIACDLLDGAAAYLGRRNGTLPTSTAVVLGATAIAAAGLGVAALQADA